MMKKNLLLLLMMSFLLLFQMQASPAIPQTKANNEHARKIRCLVISGTGHFESMHPKSLREIMEGFGNDIEYTTTGRDLSSLSVETLLEYDVVWVFNFNTWDQVNTTGIKISDLLASYVKKGGYLMEALHLQEMDKVANFGLLGGAYITEKLSPFEPATELAAGSSNMGKVVHPEHPVMDRVRAVNVTAPIYITDVRDNATTLAYYYETEAPLVAVYDNIVAVNISPIDLNLSTGVGSFVYGDGHRIFHNGIKWLFSNKYDITAPNGVVDLKASPAPNGAQFNITLDWTNPAYLINGDDLTNFTAIKIYRDGTLVKTLANPTKGEAMSWMDENVPAGSHTYKMVAMDGEKLGYPAEIKTFSGKDTPAPVYTITLAPKGNGAYLTWKNSQYGINKGWIDTENLTYKIVRQPGNVTVAEAHKANEFTDNTITEKKRYYYQITPKTPDGTGQTEQSGAMYLYTNGNIYMGTSRVATCGGKFYGPEGPDSNYKTNTSYVLILYPENQEAGSRIQVDFKKLDLNFKLGSADELHIFDGPDLDAKPVPGSPFSGQQVSSGLVKLQASAGNTSGALTFGFLSDNIGVGTGWEADISCVTLFNKDLAAISVKGEAIPAVGKTYTYKAIVRNEGLNSQSGFTVKFFEGTPNNVLESIVVNKTLAAGDTAQISFMWTPTTLGQTQLGISVVLDDDEKSDNDRSLPYTVNVQTATTVEAPILNDYDLSTVLVPFNFFYKTSVSQSLYLNSEVNLAQGKITAIRYYSVFGNEVANERVIIHIAETAKKDLSGGWIPVAQMKKVYEGIKTFPVGRNEITIVLDSSFDYQGGNLVIRTEHPMSKYDFTLGEAFDVRFDDKNNFRSLMYASQTTNFDEKTAPLKSFQAYPCLLFAMDVSEAASIKGTVTSKGLAVDSVLVKVVGTSYFATTNAQGQYHFPSLKAGTYTLEFSKYSYVTQSVADVEITNGNLTVKDVELYEIPRAIISGKIIDNEGSNLADARVELKGYDNYFANTLEDGTFSISRVYTEKEYDVIVTKDRFTSYKGKLTFGLNDTTLNPITLVQIAYPVLNLRAENTEGETAMNITWQDPADMKYTRITYDNGEATTAYSVRPEIAGWFGTVFTVADSGYIESIDLFGVQHVMLDSGDIGVRQLYVDIFDANRNKVARSDAFYMPAEQWINIPMNYMPYKGTFYAMVYFPAGRETEYSNSLGGDLWGPNANNQTNYYSDGLAWGVVQSMAQVDPFVFLLRANVFTNNKTIQLQPDGKKGEDNTKVRQFTDAQKREIAEKKTIERTVIEGSKITRVNAPEKANPSTKAYPAKFTVYRLPKAKIEQSSEWTLLTPNSISEKSFTDEAFSALTQGAYHYAVKSHYTSELISVPILSNIVYKDMMTTINFTGRTNTATNDIEGAQVRLTSMDTTDVRVYTDVFDAEGKLSIKNVWKGNYALNVFKVGYSAFDTLNLEFTEDSSYALQIDLKQEKRAPYNLKILPNDNEKGTYTFNWNESKDIAEGFEGHADFTINSKGKAGWAYRDYDKSMTWAINGTDFPGAGDAMAYIIFNPSQTTPPMEGTPDIFPYKGKKFLGSFAAAGGVANDDWFISPPLNYLNEFTFSFMARSFSSSDGLEKIQVGYSFTGMDKDDFIWVQGGQYLSIPAKWVEYTYTIPGSAKYVAIRNVTFNTYFLMIDEVFIGNEKAGTSAIKGYKVYLDGVEVAQTQNKEHVFTGVNNPENRKAGVKALYETGESEISEIDFITVGMEDDAFAKTLQVYPNPAKDVIFLDGLEQSATYEIYNMYGSMLKTHKTSNNVEQISISDLSSGSYVIRIISTQGTAVKRFIKK